MVNEIGTIYPRGLNKGFGSKFFVVGEFDKKNLKKAEGHISRNVDEDNIPITQWYKLYQCVYFISPF